MRLKGVSATGLARMAVSRLMRRELCAPVLIVGCGRSGTTILGTALAQHQDITYLNEPHKEWARAYACTDIWSQDARDRGGRLALTSADTTHSRNRAARRNFNMRLALDGGTVLVEKLPANSFRIDFTRAIFPAARFIHIFRNGVEVAASIAKYAERSSWWGVNDYKWQQLCVVAAASEETRELPDSCTDDYERGLLEWRLSTAAVVGALSDMPRQSYFELSYAHLVRDPVASLSSLLDFVGVPTTPHVLDYVGTNVSRRSAEVSARQLTNRELLLGGPLLMQSLDVETRGLVPATSASDATA